MVEIRSSEALRDWLSSKPDPWPEMIAARAALRILPLGLSVRGTNTQHKKFSLSLFRANFFAWASCNWPNKKVIEAALRASAEAKVASKDYSPVASRVAYFACDATAADSTNNCARAVRAGASDAKEFVGAYWRAISSDCNWLAERSEDQKSAAEIIDQKIWRVQPMPAWEERSVGVGSALLARDQSFSVWIEWLHRRIIGKKSAFDIPGDDDGIEDRKIIGYLASANNKDFWDKGAYFVNTTLQNWIDEARARVAPPSNEPLPEAPAQDNSAISYGVNRDGRIDRLVIGNQQQLRDLPDQRLIYADVRQAFEQLVAEGQRLGENLTSALDRMMQSMPEAFEDAQAYLVWRDGNRLRRLYLAHRSLSLTIDPDPARLEPAIAEQLGGALDLFNLFAMGDDGMRSKDEATIPFQERANAETEAALAKPIVAAMLDTPAILTDAALGDIQASVDDGGLPSDDPYDAQTRVQTNTTWRNIIAAMFTAVRAVVIRGPQFAGKEMSKGALAAMGGFAVTDVAGVTHLYGPMFEFVATNASALSTYAATAFSNYRVDLLIEAVLRYFKAT